MQHFEELYRVFRCVFLKSVDKSEPCAFVNCCPLVEMFLIFPQAASQAGVGYLLYIDLHFLSWDGQLRVSTVMLSGRLCLTAICSKPHSLCGVYHPRKAASVTVLGQTAIYTVPPITKELLCERFPDGRLLFLGMSGWMGMRPVRFFPQRLPCAVIALCPPFHAGQTDTILF